MRDTERIEVVARCLAAEIGQMRPGERAGLVGRMLSRLATDVIQALDIYDADHPRKEVL